MEIQENCIQLKIDTIISEINQNREDIQNEEKNNITALIGYSHCLDLYDFLKLYSKVQKNELLFQAAIIYDSIGYSELSMDYIDQALLLIPNVPSIILYKSGLYANQNKIDEAQKWLLKYKYLIGENKYDNYIHDSLQTLFYFLLEYEEFIILRKINTIEEKYSDLIKENFILYHLKSKILEKLAQKIKNSDNKRYISYIKQSNKIKNTYLRRKTSENDFLKEQGIKPENMTKLLLFICPQCLNYLPKKLDEYKNNFIKSGFSLFYTLIKISKIIKLKLEIKKYKKIYNQKIRKENQSDPNNLNNLMNIISNASNEQSNDESIKLCQESIKNLYNCIWLKGFSSENNEKNLDKYFNKQNININYYIKEGYYSHLNLQDNIIKYIKYNEEFKQKNLNSDIFLDDITLRENESQPILNDDNKEKSKANIIINNKSPKNNDTKKESQNEIKKIQNMTTNNKYKNFKNSLSDILKKVITKRSKESHKNKRNKINNNEKDKNSKGFCSTDNCNNQMLSKSITTNKNKTNIIKIDSNVKIDKKEKDENKNNKKDDNKPVGEMENHKKTKIEFVKKPEVNKNKNEKIEKHILNNNYFIGFKNKDIKNVNGKNRILSTNTSNKKLTLNSKDKSKTINKNMHNNPIFCFGDDKKMDTDYGKYKDVHDINLVSYCLKQLMKKREIKNKKSKQKEIINLTDKMDIIPAQKLINYEKQAFQINDNKYSKNKNKKKKLLNQSLKNQIYTFNFEKISKKNSQKNSQNNILNSNKNSYSSNALNNINPKNLKKTNLGNSKKELSKFKSLNYLYGNFYSNNNYLNINFNNYMNYNFNYSNRHEDKKNLDFKFNQNSDKKRDESSYSKDKFNFRTINLDFKNISTKLNSHSKKPLLNSFIDSKEKNKKYKDKNYEYVIMPFNKIKSSPSGEMYYLKKKNKNIKTNLIKQKEKTSFSKYMLYNLGKKQDVFYFSKSINTSEFNKYKNSVINKSKKMKSKYNKTMNSKSNYNMNK